jgi:hypothetical protein
MSLRIVRWKALWALLALSLLTGCGGGSSSSVIPSVTDTTDFADLRPYDSTGPYAAVLKSCATAETTATSCTLDRLPIIGMEKESPTTADIMSRVLVSHEWMGQRFEQALNNLPADIRLLLRATTAIVIDDDIRPAYYTARTGAIYLDPAYLWLTSGELATISRKQDHRAGYSDPLQFRSLHRYTRNGSHLYPFGLLTENPDKTIDDVTLLIGQLLYHELAHANDFLPPATWDYLDSSRTVYQAIANNEANFVATRLATNDPLNASALYSLAKVMYWGEDPSAADLAITVDEVGELFEADGANDHYAYASAFEDSAMLFEETMMKYHFGTDRDVAFTPAPDDGRYCDDYVIGWGVRNRIGDTDVKARAQFVTGELLPSLELSLFFQELPAPQLMMPGSNWCLSAPTANGLEKSRPHLLPTRNLHHPHAHDRPHAF